jgi:pimeloyl-ACP methyl ester carboxylesterase
MFEEITRYWLSAAGLSIAGLGIIYGGISTLIAKKISEAPRSPINKNLIPGFPDHQCRDVAFPSRDGITLKGWYFPANSPYTVIIVSGGFQSRLDLNVNTPGLASGLVDRRYSVLLFDQRGRGESEGKARTLYNIDPDLGGAVDYLQTKGFALQNTFILGYSAGAASACIYASRNPIAGVVLDGCFACLQDTIKRAAGNRSVPTFIVDLLLPGVRTISRLKYDFKPVNPVDVVADISCPVFFIHEENDEIITLEEMQRLYTASTNPSNRLWEVRGADHSQSYQINPGKYINQIDGFISEITGRKK